MIAQLVVGPGDYEHGVKFVIGREAVTRIAVGDHAVYCATHRTGMGVFLHEYKSVEGRAKARVMAMRDRYEQLVSGIIKDGQKDGSFRKDVDAKLTVRLILGMINWLYHWYSESGPLNPEQIGQAMADMALRGIKT